ncbi:MAG: hypothetical protein KDK70_23075, partial [Myxococcales bacterium]|nr:hypothetical protein [Myxococcales bacterium]
RATYVFSGWHEELVVKALELRAKRAWAAEQRRETRASEPANESTDDLAFSRAAMLRTMGESSTLRAVADVLQESPSEQRTPRRAPAPGDYLERLDVRSHVQAMAEQLGRDPGDVLRALGRESMRELEVSDRQRLAQVFAELSSGP